MIRRFLKILSGFAATVIAVALIAVASLGVWVMTGPKTLTKLTPYIENSLNAQLSPYKISVKDAIFAWDSWINPLDFRLRHVALRSAQDVTLLKLDELSLKLDIPSLFRLKIVPHSVVLHSPTLHVFRDEEGEFILGFIGAEGERATGIPISHVFASLSAVSSGGEGDAAGAKAIAGSIQRIAIRHGRLTLGNTAENSVFDAPDTNLEITRKGDALQAMFIMDMQSEAGISHLRVGAQVKPGDEMIVAQARLKRFSLHQLARLFPAQPEWAALNMPLDGEALLSVDMHGNLTTLDFKVEGRKGVFSLPQHFATKIPIRTALLEGQFRNNLTQLLLNQASLDFFGATLSLNGFAMRSENGWSYDALAVAENMPVNDLYKYWPKTLAPTPYHWVTKHIRDGVVTRAEAKVSVKDGQQGQPLAEDALAVAIHTEGVSVEYLEGHPKVQNVKGLVTFTGKAMEITSQQGSMLTGARLNDAWLSIPDLTSEKPEMLIKLSVDAPAADVATYLAIPSLNYAAPLGLDAATITGTASGNLGFTFFLPDHEHPEEDSALKLHIETELKDASQPGFMGEGNLSAVNGKLVITEQQVEYNGAMTLDDAPLRVALLHTFDETQRYPTSYKAVGNLTIAQLKAFGLPELPFLDGALGLAAEVQRNPSSSVTRAVVDATQVAALLPEIGFSKAAGIPARIEFEAEKKADALVVRAFSLQGKGMEAKGKAALSQHFGKLDSLDFDRLFFGQNDFSGSVAQAGEGYTVRAQGNSVDLSPFFDKKDKNPAQEETSDDLPFAVDLQAEMDTLILSEKSRMYHVNARFKCLTKYCESADFRGVTSLSQPEQSGFNYRILRGEDGKRKAIISAQNAGDFLKAMDLYDNMNGGVLTIQGVYDDADPQRPMRGTFEITENNITKAPALARLASLLSLTGIADTISGKGISFKKIKGNVAYTDRYILFKDGRAIGPALGITFDNGLLNRKTDEVNFSGTVVPSYTLNSAVGSIPVIGEVLSGGEGEGMFAATYKVQGVYPDKIDVSVNPLSMLAPGFLRNLFGSSETPELPKVPEQERLPGEPPKAPQAQ